MYLFNNLKFNHSVQRTIGDVQYPPGWFNDPAERAKIGVTEVPDPIRPDDNLFTSVENPDGSWTETPRTAAELAARLDAKKSQANAAIKAEMAAADLTIIRALIEGDAPRIAAFKLSQAALRAKMQ